VLLDFIYGLKRGSKRGSVIHLRGRLGEISGQMRLADGRRKKSLHSLQRKIGVKGGKVLSRDLDEESNEAS